MIQISAGRVKKETKAVSVIVKASIAWIEHYNGEDLSLIKAQLKMDHEDDSASKNTARNQLLKDYMARVANDRDRDAFSLLFDHFAPLIRAFSFSSQPGAALVADDLAQEVMIKVWEKAGTYKPEAAAVSTWVFTLARNCRIDQFRKNGRFTSNIDPTYLWEEVEDENADPFQSMQQNRAEERVKEGLSQLPVEQSQVLAKVYMEGKSHQEAADELSLPLGTVKSRIRLAVEKLGLILTN